MHDELDIDADPEILGRILKHIPEIVLVVDRDGMQHYINRVEEGYDRGEVIGTSADAIMTPEARVVFWAALETLLECGEPQEYESEVVAPDGQTRWYRSRMVALRKDGEITGAIVMAENITELKAAQEEAAQLKKLLPICSWCEKIHTEDGGWQTIEVYLKRREGTTVSHGLCPECYQRQLDGMDGSDGSNGNVA